MKTNSFKHPLIERLFGGNRVFILSTFILWVMLDGVAWIYLAQK